jgi:hypothetical protein
MKTLHMGRAVAVGFLLLTGCTDREKGEPLSPEGSVTPQMVFLPNGQRWFKDNDYAVQIENLPHGRQRAWLLSKGDQPGQTRIHFVATLSRTQEEVVITRMRAGELIHTKIDRTGNIKGMLTETLPRASTRAELGTASMDEYCDVIWTEEGEPIYNGPPYPEECIMPEPGMPPEGEWSGSGTGLSTEWEKCCTHEWNDREFSTAQWGASSIGVIAACWSPLVLLGVPCLAATALFVAAVADLRDAQWHYSSCANAAMSNPQCFCNIKVSPGIILPGCSLASFGSPAGKCRLTFMELIA